jgi:diguanylate cyclase (GGDEF)-like protein
MNQTYQMLIKEKDQILHNFMEKYFFVNKDLSQKSLKLLFNIFDQTLIDFIREDRDCLEKDYKRLASLGIRSNVPYVVLIHELEFIKNRVMGVLFESGINDVAISICKMYGDFEKIIAKRYLQNYIRQLSHKNRTKITNLGEMHEREVVQFYESHLIWLEKLIMAIKHLKLDDFPITDVLQCSFGKWLEGKGREVISNRSKYRNLVKQHEALHYIASKIKSFLEEKNHDYHIFMTYLEKAEMISLDIGTELAMIDNSIMIVKSKKDKLTGALNRNLLEGIFAHQYELALATSKPFVIAMSDLDDFKTVNDRYGHLVGDEILKGFAAIALDSLRASDIMIRFGGEEFLFIIPAVEKAKGIELFDKIRERFEDFAYPLQDEQVGTTVSIGVTEVQPVEGSKPSDIHVEEFIKRADEKMYLAKRSGKNRVR